MEKQDDVLLQLRVERPLYEQETLNLDYCYERPRTSLAQYTKELVKCKNWKSCISSSIPAVTWLKRYRWKDDLVYDMISGLTVAIMHIPQGMAYALLGNLPPVVGIYMAFFPVLVYFFFGTSKHVSMGTFAVVCLMTGKAVTSYSVPLNDHRNVTTFTQMDKEYNSYTSIQVATAVTLSVGIFQIIMYIFRLGVISTLLSETLVNSFTTGAAIHVLLSQIKDLLGLKLPKQKGYFKLIQTVISIAKEISNINVASAIVSTIAIIIMVFNNEFIKPWAGKKCGVPIPIELIAVVSGTLVSKYGNLTEVYNIQNVGHIPTGLPTAELPTLELLPLVAVDSIAITMVSYTITMSMALIFAQKLNYEVDSNQELFAMGVSNIVGSFFSCMPFSASLSRSLIQQTVGGRSQIASIVSCSILLIILLWIGPFFEPLPRCILASIIVVALKGMLQQATQLIKFWKLSKSDAIIWIVTFLIVILVSIDIGLLAGLIVSLASVLLQSIRPYTCLLGHIPNSDLYLDLNRYKVAKEIEGIKIFHYSGSLNFANRAHFKSEVYKLIGINPQKVIRQRLKLKQKNIHLDEQDFEHKDGLRCIIMNMSAVSYIDPAGVNVIHAVASEFSEIQIHFYLASCTSPIFEMIKKCEMYTYKELSFKIFATIEDAVSYSRSALLSR
ncbi:sulfate transporter isoform X1 [Vespa crabro]|uniref:sulfate transporter isoform X1 n=2 Tax=Vespa crabro TaxID=7445 RepID=UPI001F014C4A|nr:sulfate transporter isoform X1 [Vespa crabro]XP_046815513.1 sulfate transporter isoform X1 [Vespa crabro]XP_046815515.1 sulfate transporter isoform X1 [Vespa crabro]